MEQGKFCNVWHFNISVSLLNYVLYYYGLVWKYITLRIQNVGRGPEFKRGMILLKHKILSSIVLRRTKKGRAADLALPPSIVSGHTYVCYLFVLMSKLILVLLNLPIGFN